MRTTVLSALVLFSVQVLATEPHPAVKRIVVFPLQVESEYRDLAEEMWWALRAKLTENKRFLVASRNFMEAKGVFQPRGNLEAADAIILGRLLDAHALITLRLTGRSLSFQVYDGRKGYPLWQRLLELHPSLPLSKQLPSVGEKLMLDFLASIPYQGVVVSDTLVGRPTYKAGDLWRVQAEIGTDLRVSIGDKIQLVELNVTNLEPAFDKGGEIKVLGEGKVIERKDQKVVVDLDRVGNVEHIKEGTLVRIPGEYRRLQETFALGEGHALPEVPLLETGRKLTPEQEQKKPLITSLSFLANLVIVLIVAL